MSPALTIGGKKPLKIVTSLSISGDYSREE